METSILETLGQIAGIGGITAGIFFLLFRDLLKTSLSGPKGKAEGERRFKLIVYLIWSLALVGIISWTGVAMFQQPVGSAAVEAKRDIKARDIEVNGTSGEETSSGDVKAGRDINARDIKVGK